MAPEFQRGDAVVFVRAQTTHTVGAPNAQRVSVTVGVVVSVTRDGRIKSYRSGADGSPVRLHRHSVEHRAQAYRLPRTGWDIDAIAAYCAARPWAHAPQHHGAPFDGLDQARAELRQFRLGAAV